MVLSLNRVQADGSHANFDFYLINLEPRLPGNHGHTFLSAGVSQPWHC